MRVLYVETAAGFGGSLTAILDTVGFLPDHVQPFLAIGYDPTAYRNIPDRLNHEIVPLAGPPDNGSGRLRTVQGFAKRTTKQASAIDKIAKRINPTIIHANNSSATNVASALVGCRRAIPVVSHQRGMEYAGLPNRLILRSKLFDHHIAVSGPIMQQMLTLGVRPERCTTIYDAIVPPPPSPSGLPKGHETVIAMYSMLLPWKGQEVFLRAIARVARVVTVPFRVVIGGAEPFGETAYRLRLENLVADLDIRARVDFIGYQKNICDELAKTDILVLASVDPEPGGHIVQEAMMYGVPVVTTDDGGPAEYVRASGAGLVVPRNNVELLANAISELIVDPQLRRTISEQGTVYARREFSPPSIVSKWIAIYENVIAMRSRSRR